MARWAATLGLVIWLDAPDAVLSTRIRSLPVRYAMINGLYRGLYRSSTLLMRGGYTYAPDQTIRYPEQSNASRYTFSIWAFPEERYTHTLREYFRWAQGYLAATGFRPDPTLLGELRLDLDDRVEAARALAPLIDPNVHSCGSVPPHGVDELSHPDEGVYMVGMKSYGRAPTFLLRTGYEQVRSIAAAKVAYETGGLRERLAKYHRDVDVAMAKVADAIKDWSGGTRIGASLREFNFKWARRMLAQNACVLLVSDGLDREAGEGLAEEMERLAKSCRQLVWLTPLLRYEEFEARPAGVRAMLPHVDLFLPVHNLKSLVDLARTLSTPIKERPLWK